MKKLIIEKVGFDTLKAGDEVYNEHELLIGTVTFCAGLYVQVQGRGSFFKMYRNQYPSVFKGRYEDIAPPIPEPLIEVNEELPPSETEADNQ